MQFRRLMIRYESTKLHINWHIMVYRSLWNAFSNLFAKFYAPQLCLMIISGCRMMVISWVE